VAQAEWLVPRVGGRLAVGGQQMLHSSNEPDELLQLFNEKQTLGY